MNIGSLLAVAVTVITVLGYLGFAPNGPRMLAKLSARLSRRRREREALQQRVLALEQQVATLRGQVTDLQRFAAADSKNMLFNRTPEAQRIQAAAKAAMDHTIDTLVPHA